MTSIYRLRFFFDYNCGGCLWSDNETAFKNFGVGCLDAESYDLHGNISQEARIKLPEKIKLKVLELDKLFAESINLNDPAGDSVWSEKQWHYFYEHARELYQQIVEILVNKFEVVYGLNH